MTKSSDTDAILWATKARATQRNRAHILRMVLVGLVVFLLIIGVFFLFYSQMNLLLQEQSSFYLQEITTKSAERLKEKVDGDLRMLEGIALFLGGLDQLDVDHWLSVMQDNPLFAEFQRYGFMLADGRMYTQEIDGLDFSDRQYFKDVMQGKTTISEVFIDNLYQKPTLAYGVPIRQKGTIVGALGVGLVVQEYESYLHLPSFAGEGTMHLLDKNGSIILKLGNASIPKRLSLDTLRDEFLSGESGIVRLDDKADPRLLAYAPVGVQQWMLLVEIPNKFLLETQRKTKLYALLMALLYGALMLFFPYYILFKRRNYELSLLKLAYFDEMTGIANYTLFEESATHLVHDKDPTKYACIVLNIRRFKLINDLFGYSYGDTLLKQVAAMLPTFCKEDELYGRKDGDRFLLLLKEGLVEERVRKILATLNTIALPDTAQFSLEFVAGIYHLEETNIPIPICMDRATLALDHLKDDHGAHYMVYNEAIRDKLLDESELVKGFQQALAEKQFFVVLQPKFNMFTAKIVGCEALIRWNHPVRGLLAPIQFIPVFEEHNLITELDMFVLREVCEKLIQWQGQGLEVLPVSVNQSRAHLDNPTYVSDLIHEVDQYGLDHSLLEFEMTESIFLSNLTHLKAVVSELRKAGFCISIDDFGSGYSSLNMLKNISVDFLKLDREFLMEAEDDIRSQKVIRSAIQMAHDLGMLVIAEGVETKAQAEMLMGMECTIAQGYYYERPISMEAFERLLAK